MNAKRRIIMLNLDSDLYGANKVFFQVAKALKEEGHDILIFLPGDGPLVELFKIHGFAYRSVNLAVVRRKYFNLSGLLNRSRRFIKAYRVLKNEAINWRADTIYTNTILIWVGMVVARSLRLRHFWHLHEMLGRGIPKRIFGFFLAKNNDTFICVSQAVIDCWQQYFNPKCTCRLLFNGVPKPEFTDTQILRKELALAKDTLLIGLIGRINFIKGQPYFIDIAKEITKTRQNVEFVIVGDPYPGNEYLVDELANQIKDYGLTNVHLLGFRNDIGNVLQSLDIMMFPSVTDDSFPLVVLEGMQSSLPIVATHQGGVKEMIEEGKSGVFIPINDAKVAAEKIQPLLDDKEKRKQMGESAYERVNQYFSEKTFRENLIQIFN
ncbi:glycosyltransferase family 4 protein [Algoriphagus jejuensis]|uniref:Glycosyltransferase family 4 protein n=1 Tax=Algoriphagus jejuensis TaxID=419934 RepID=A0ABN1N0U2_9BACT